MIQILATLWHRLRADFALLLAFLGLAGLSFVFLKLASEMLEGETMALDRIIIRGLRTAADPAIPIGPGWFETMMLDLTAIGGVWGLTAITVFVAGFLIVARKYATAMFVAGSVIGGAALGTLLKSVFERARPDVVPHLVEVYDASFPSGHAMNSAVVFLTLGALLASTQKSRRVRIYLICVAVALTLGVGFSRVYLGVHWPSDVIAGWCVGAAWAILCWIAARLLQRTHRIEQPGEVAADDNDMEGQP
ncbi:phosphatase PAP2 family protein [Sphingomonas sp. AOB5]|uniref:phosphatase PAP2 family protein n=1 Tax=Sphingomonas sp. AOB5 TaxID=3034017 RepID=UPI0023F8A4CF|nr:phosphatase PAP2 family protein [Sphingomonas sp. AOB5]MDF7774654.1 phosphatase PAP2 family protein [Sphingomonas sp. AOB5]